MRKLILILLVLVSVQSIKVDAQIKRPFKIVYASPPVTDLLTGYAYLDLTFYVENPPITNTSNVWSNSGLSGFSLSAQPSNNVVLNTSEVFKYTADTKSVSHGLQNGGGNAFQTQAIRIEFDASGVVSVYLEMTLIEVLPTQPTVGQYIGFLRKTLNDGSFNSVVRVTILDSTGAEVYGKDYTVYNIGDTNTRIQFDFPNNTTSKFAYPQIK